MTNEPLFNKGTILNNTIKIIDYIGSGGQGEVYLVKYYDKQYALKWYYAHIVNQNLKRVIINLISKGAPNQHFLWPIKLVEENNQFGYLMELRPPNYRSLNEWVKLEFDMNLSTIALACFKLTNAFNKLHAIGLSYKDISLDNIFVDPKRGDILICDNDNITANGINVGGLLGTPKFMAPELVMGSTIPNTESDQFSLAVLLFYILLVSHPFEGRLEANITCFNDISAKMLYGTDAVFIYDEANPSNRPVLGIHNNAINLWPIYPKYIRDLFHKTFTIGVRNPLKRTRESEWRTAFLKLYNSLFKCSNCGQENIYELKKYQSQGKLDPCIYCKQDFQIPPRIGIKDNIIVLSEEKGLFVCHINPNEPANLTLVGRINKISSDYIITNVSKLNWKINGQKILPQMSKTLINGDIIDFGLTTGEIRF